jgi:hypothetical protein
MKEYLEQEISLEIPKDSVMGKSLRKQGEEILLENDYEKISDDEWKLNLSNKIYSYSEAMNRFYQLNKFKENAKHAQSIIEEGGGYKCCKYGFWQESTHKNQMTHVWQDHPIKLDGFLVCSFCGNKCDL